jgi:hypothetical protein
MDNEYDSYSAKIYDEDLGHQILELHNSNRDVNDGNAELKP